MVKTFTQRGIALFMALLSCMLFVNTNFSSLEINAADEIYTAKDVNNYANISGALIDSNGNEISEVVYCANQDLLPPGSNNVTPQYRKTTLSSVGFSSDVFGKLCAILDPKNKIADNLKQHLIWMVLDYNLFQERLDSGLVIGADISALDQEYAKLDQIKDKYTPDIYDANYYICLNNEFQDLLGKLSYPINIGVTKKVVGEGAKVIDADTEYKFALSFLNESKEPVSDVSVEIGDGEIVKSDSDGIVEFTLKANETKTISIIDGDKVSYYSLSEDRSTIPFEQYCKVSGEVTEPAQINAGTTNVTVTNDYDHIPKVKVSKTDGEKELGSAALAILDKDGNTVESWETEEGKSHEIIGKLTVGETYTLHEVTPPKGYKFADDIKFTVNDDDTVTVNDKKVDTIVMIDEPTNVKISKTDGEKEIPDANLQVYDHNGKLVWNLWSATEVTVLVGVLTAGQTYTIVEYKAPDGYTYARNIIFEIKRDGSISINGETVDSVVMKDDETSVTISKTDITGDKEIAGASLQLIDKNGNVVDSWTSE